MKDQKVILKDLEQTWQVSSESMWYAGFTDAYVLQTNIFALLAFMVHV